VLLPECDDADKKTPVTFGRLVMLEMPALPHAGFVHPLADLVACDLRVAALRPAAYAYRALLQAARWEAGFPDYDLHFAGPGSPGA